MIDFNYVIQQAEAINSPNWLSIAAATSKTQQLRRESPQSTIKKKWIKKKFLLRELFSHDYNAAMNKH